MFNHREQETEKSSKNVKKVFSIKNLKNLATLQEASPSYQRQKLQQSRDERPSKRLPLTPQDTLTLFKSLLTIYEQTEIALWKDIFFAGSASIEKIGSSRRRTGADMHQSFNLAGTFADTDGGIFNFGYDDSRGDLYLTRHDHIAYKYEILSLLGSGSFGQVVKVFDHRTKRHLALKIIRNKRRFEKQGIVEVNVLKKLLAEDLDSKYCLVHLNEHFYFRGHLCFAFELLGSNLYEWLKAGSFQGIHLGLISNISKQILMCLGLLYDLNIIHCDLKPENILLCDPKFLRPRSADTLSSIPGDFNPSNPIYNIKVIDFGSSCFENERLYTYVQSRFYRAPEVILGLPYTTSIDMWSLGCVLAELYTGYPLFPGENESDQLACMMEISGLPLSSFLARGSRSRTFFNSSGVPRTLANSKGKKRRVGSKTLESVMKCGDPSFLSFLQKCLVWDPLLRLTPHEAMLHPFITRKMIARKPIEKHAFTQGGFTVSERLSLAKAQKKSLKKYASTPLLDSSEGFSSKEPNDKSKLPLIGTIEKWRSSFNKDDHRKSTVKHLLNSSKFVEFLPPFSAAADRSSIMSRRGTKINASKNVDILIFSEMERELLKSTLAKRKSNSVNNKNPKRKKEEQVKEEKAFKEVVEDNVVDSFELEMALLEQSIAQEEKEKELELKKAVVSAGLTGELIEATLERKGGERAENEIYNEKDQIKEEQEQLKQRSQKILEKLKKKREKLAYQPDTSHQPGIGLGSLIRKKLKTQRVVRPFADDSD